MAEDQLRFAGRRLIRVTDQRQLTVSSVGVRDVRNAAREIENLRRGSK